MNYHDGERLVYDTMNSEPSQERLDKVLQQFVETRENRWLAHGNWVHSLSHFTEWLWQKSQWDWIKRLNEIAFRGAIELGDSNCCNRLVDDFVQYAPFDLNPADFYLAMDNLQWMKWDDPYNLYAKQRIEHGPFASEDDLLRCQLTCGLRNPRQFLVWHECQNSLVDVEAIHSRIQKLQELGADTSEFSGLERQLLEKKLAELESEVKEFEISDATKDWSEESKEQRRQWNATAIALTKAALDK
jgi:hypothetical protein